MKNKLISVKNLKTSFPIKGGLVRKTIGHVHAVEDISFDIATGETFGLVGESGCGKTTTGRSVLRLIEPSAGNVFFEGVDICKLSHEEMRQTRRNMQLVFQNPYAALNPRMTVKQLLEEPLMTHFKMTDQEKQHEIAKIMEKVGLSKTYLNRYPHQFSGGQRQRICIARALICKPKFVVADEPVSALDVSIQSQILNLMSELQDEMQLSYLLISHNLSVIRHISHRIGVMYLGRIVESGKTHLVYDKPSHPYTRALISAIPQIGRGVKNKKIRLVGDVPNPANPPSGCAFHTRCRHCMKICKEVAPVQTIIEEDHIVSCHLFR